MINLILFIVALLFIFLIHKAYKKAAIAKREKYINTYSFPRTISQKVIERYPHLSERDAQGVINGLREYFHICNIAGGRMVSMPSQVVDVAWHEFILFTKEYQVFCHCALGRFLHHTPAEAMKSPTRAQAGIKTAWKISCFRENIAPKSPNKLPLLFSIDTQLEIEDGFTFSLNCSQTNNGSYCATHINCGSGCGGCSGDASGCSGGCGGD